MVDVIGREQTLRFVAVLCVGQFAWTCWAERAALGWIGFVAALVAVGLCLLGFERFRAWGAVLVGEAKARNAARSGDPQG